MTGIDTIASFANDEDEQAAYAARCAYIAEEYPAGKFCCRCLEVEPSELPTIAICAGLCPDCISNMKYEYLELTEQYKALTARLDPKRRAFEVVYTRDGFTIHVPPHPTLDEYNVTKGALGALLQAVGT